jgi:hypothetical protein
MLRSCRPAHALVRRGSGAPAAFPELPDLGEVGILSFTLVIALDDIADGLRTVQPIYQGLRAPKCCGQGPDAPAPGARLALQCLDH